MKKSDALIWLKRCVPKRVVPRFIVFTALLQVAFAVSTVQAENVTLRWDESRGQVSGYRLYVKEKPWDAFRMVWQGKQARHTFATLGPGCGKKYIFTVRAYNRSGESEDSNGVEYEGACVDIPDVALQGFDSSYYLNSKLASVRLLDTAWADKDVVFLENWFHELGMTAEEHYIHYGRVEGLAPNRYFNHGEYILAMATAMYHDGDYATVEEARTALKKAWPGDAYRHYIQYGAAKAINPSNTFDEGIYLSNKLASLQMLDPDWNALSVDDLRSWLISINLTPLTHYLVYGRHDGLAAPAVPLGERVDAGGAP